MPRLHLGAKILLLGMLQWCCSGQSDLTVQERSVGSAVVQAVSDRIRSGCIYPDDRLFIRRLAIVQSDDGNAASTYRAGYDGGIWQVDEDKFNTTKNCANSRIREECSLILSEFQINWSSVQWSDLLKPLYSGLAASLYLKLQGADPAPGNLTGQASLWKSHFQPSRDISTYISQIQQKETSADDSCDYKPIDIVFIIDESGSVGSSNFAKVLTFLTQVVDNLKIGPTSVQVGLVKFNSRATLEFRLGAYSTKSSLQSAILKTQYGSGGTSIGAGIQYADTYVFPLKYGGRKDATKIAILVTDGRSSSASFTKRAADNAKDNHIRIFAVGIGSINIVELNSAANDPDCTHVSLLSTFSQIDDIIYEIKKSACRASNPIGDTGVSEGEVPTGDGSTIEIETDDGNNKTITTEINCGVMNVYSSFATSHPGPAFHDQTDMAIAGSPSVMFVPVTDSRPLYVTFVRHDLDPSCPNSSYTGEVSNDPPVDTGTDILCKLNGRWQVCDSSKVDGDDNFEHICGVFNKNDWNTISNPCTEGGPKYYSHPSDLEKFITCDDTQKMYISQCPTGKIYSNQGCVSAHMTTIGSGTDKGQINVMNQYLILCRVNGNLRGCQSQDLPADFYEKLCEGTTPSVQNPCTSCAIADHHIVHPHPSDDNKYITCDGGNSHTITQCPLGERFSVAKQGCIPSTDHGDVIEDDSNQNDGNSNHDEEETEDLPSDNPCTAEARAQNKYYFPFTPDRTKFIQCDEWGNKFIMPCPSGQVWSDAALTCVVDALSTNPCTGKAGKMVAHRDVTKYIQCDGSGTAHVMSCPGGLKFYVSKSRCDW